MFFTMTTKLILNCFILIICYCSAFAQVGDRCVVKSTGVAGVCRISASCPVAQEQAENGISPTICGFYQLTVPIVCCEINPFAETNGESSEPNSSDSSEHRQPNNSNSYGHREPNPNTFLNQETNNPDAFVYPDNENEQQVVPQHLSKSEQKCQEYSKAVTGVVQAIPLLTNTQPTSINYVMCDYNSVALIVGGKPASPGEFPFMAAIGFYVEDKVEWRCGGTLISEYYVLTAAHCTFTRDGDSPKVVRLGELDLTRDDDDTVYADYDIRHIKVHPQYRYPQKYYDIALVQLSLKVKFTKYIRPACLYTKSQVDQQAIATGWGKTDYAALEISDKLMKVHLTVYNNDRCTQTYQVSKQLPQGIKSNMICAGELKGGQDTCQGDSGGPLLITKKGNHCKFYVVGITSFGKSCGQANTPAVYTKVSEFVPWIEKIIW